LTGLTLCLRPDIRFSLFCFDTYLWATNIYIDDWWFASATLRLRRRLRKTVNSSNKSVDLLALILFIVIAKSWTIVQL